MKSFLTNVVIVLVIALLSGVAHAQDVPTAKPVDAAAKTKTADNAEGEKAEDESAEAEDVVPARRGEFRSVKFESEPTEANRAWETRPYQVAVWVCHDGSPTLIDREQKICRSIEINSQLLDPSGWNIVAGTPPSQWRWKLLQEDFDAINATEVLEDPELEFFDKLMIVRIRSVDGSYEIEVREIDGHTRQLGPTTSANTGIPSLIGSIASRLLSRSFMPLTRIDEVGKTNKAEMRARGIESCIRTRINEQLQPEVVTIENSPCFIRNNDRMLPVVIRTDRGGKVVRLDAVPATYIAIESIDNTAIKGQVYSAVRAPLAGRKSKRAEKLALVIRPAEGTTVLRLVSRNDEEPEPLEGYDVVTVEVDDITKELEYHGQTDWRGEIVIPPSDDMRMLLVRRGGRRLKKIPVIPGFLPEVETTITNDETRLLAKGVVTGLENEILSLAVLRKIYVKEIQKTIEEGDKPKARKILTEYTGLEDPTDLRSRMADDEARLKAQTDAQREKKSISGMFEPLKRIASSDFLKNNEAQIRKWIDAGKVPPEPEPSEEGESSKPDKAKPPAEPPAAPAESK